MDPINTNKNNRSHLCNFRYRDRLLTVLFLWSLLSYAARGSEEGDQSSQFIASNTTLQSSKKSDIDIFYNEGLSLCEKHRIVERDTREEDAANVRRRKEKTNEREVKRIKSQDVTDEDDDEKDIESDQIEADRIKPERTETEHQTTCSQCRKSREALRNESLELIKGDILNRLGMTHPPNLTGKYKPNFGEFVVQRLLEKYGTEKHDKHHYSPRRHTTPAPPTIQWFPSDDDTSQMQGDAPPESDSSGSRDSAKDYGDRSNNVRSHMNTSDNRFSEKSSFQEGEVYIEEDDDYHVRTMKVVSFSLPQRTLIERARQSREKKNETTATEAFSSENTSVI